MSLFSDINGFNNKAIKIFEQKDEKKDDFSEVDFCLQSPDEDIFSVDTNNDFENNTPYIDENALEDLMYNYDISEDEAKEYLSNNFEIEG